MDRKIELAAACEGNVKVDIALLTPVVTDASAAELRALVRADGAAELIELRTEGSPPRPPCTGVRKRRTRRRGRGGGILGINWGHKTREEGIDMGRNEELGVQRP